MDSSSRPSTPSRRHAKHTRATKHEDQLADSMKSKTAKETRSAAPPEPANATPIGISPEEGDKLRRCAEKCGQSVPAFVHGIIIAGLEKLDGLDPLHLPCPYCDKVDELEIVTWSQQRRDGTEYDGKAMRCHRCVSIVPLAAWMKRGLHINTAFKGGAA
jgi:hypothetical protein